MFLFRLVLLPPRLAFGTTKLSYKTARFLGIRRLMLIGMGVGIGLLIAPVPGAEMRERLRAFLEEQGLFEPAAPPVAHAPATTNGVRSVTGAGHTSAAESGRRPPTS